jgi:hypothetical protein
MVGIGFSSLARAGRRAAFRQITPDSLSRATSSQAITHAAGINRFAPGPGVGLLGQTLFRLVGDAFEIVF